MSLNFMNKARTSKKFGKEILDRPFMAAWYKKQTG